MRKEVEQKIEKLADNFNNDVWGGEEDRCFIMSYKRGAKVGFEWAERLCEVAVRHDCLTELTGEDCPDCKVLERYQSFLESNDE